MVDLPNHLVVLMLVIQQLMSLRIHLLLGRLFVEGRGEFN